MQQITFHCETITPMFLAGADGTTPELRSPSIKGALRFWWRAMNGHLGLGKLRELETEIFGGTAGDSGRRSKVIVRIPFTKLETSKELPISKVPTYSKGRNLQVNIFEYLAYGTYDWNKELRQNILKRSFYKSKQSFEIRIALLDENYSKEIVLAFKLLSYFGGIGSKSRNGYGSFKINEFPNDDYIEVLKTLNGVKNSFTSFSNNTLFFETQEFSSAELAHAEIGKAYKYARECVEDKHYYDTRIYIASPLIADKVTYSFLDRHSKSYFMNVMSLPNKKFKGVILFMPYNFLEGSEDFLEKSLKNKLEDKKSSQNDKDYFTKMIKDTPISIHQEEYEYAFTEFNNLLSDKLTNVEL